MTWFEANIAAPSSSTSAPNLLTQRSNAASGSPVSRRTRIDVSIPKRWVMGFVSERLQIEGANPATELAAQRPEAGRIDSRGAQKKAVRAFLDFEPVARLQTQSIQHMCGKRDLALGRDLDPHCPCPGKCLLE